ncbi:hypothetical protein ACVWXU_008633 [Streptomyces sp. TE33382]
MPLPGGGECAVMVTLPRITPMLATQGRLPLAGGDER